MPKSAFGIVNVSVWIGPSGLGLVAIDGPSFVVAEVVEHDLRTRTPQSATAA